MVALVSAAALGACAHDAETKSAAPIDRPEITRSLMDAAAVAESQNDPTTAATYYRNVYAREPGNQRAAFGLMQSLRESGNLEQAREVADKVIAAKPDDPAVLAEVGKVRLASNQLPEAVRLLRRASELNPQDWRSRSALGVAYDRLGEPKRAEESYQDALRISPENPAVLNNFALSRAMTHDLTGARDLLQRAVASAGADLRVRQNLALIYALSGDMGKAESLTLRDLPPELARETLAYYRELSSRAMTK
jgi:Flp pilus assembly protein TadD